MRNDDNGNNEDTDVLGAADLPHADLELATTEDLVNELKRRHDCCIFISLVDMTTEHEQMRYTWKGGSTIALGALCRVRKAINRDLDN